MGYRTSTVRTTTVCSSWCLLWGFLCESKRGFLTRSLGDHFSFHSSQMITSTEGLLSLRAHHFSDMWSVFGTKRYLLITTIRTTAGCQDHLRETPHIPREFRAARHPRPPTAVSTEAQVYSDLMQSLTYLLITSVPKDAASSWSILKIVCVCVCLCALKFNEGSM